MKYLVNGSEGPGFASPEQAVEILLTLPDYVDHVEGRSWSLIQAGSGGRFQATQNASGIFPSPSKGNGIKLSKNPLNIL